MSCEGNAQEPSDGVAARRSHEPTWKVSLNSMAGGDTAVFSWMAEGLHLHLCIKSMFHLLQRLAVASLSAGARSAARMCAAP